MADDVSFAAALATGQDARAVADSLSAEALISGLGAPDLALVFASAHFAGQTDELAKSLIDRTGARNLIGCLAESIAAGDEELEDQPACALWLAWLPNSRLISVHLESIHTAEGVSFAGWPEELTDADSSNSVLILLADPNSFPADAFLARWNEDRPGMLVVGGMSSGAAPPNSRRLLFGGSGLTSGAVGVLIRGGVNIASVVSQGCRPVGKTMIVTRAERNVVLELAGKPALERLQELWDEADEENRELLQHGLHIGLAMNEYRDRFERGDFLVRNCLGADRKSGALVVGDFVRVGQTVQFHVRDAGTAGEDLRQLLRESVKADSPPAGALLFTCNGRGTRLFGAPHHDAQAVQKLAGPLPLAGFFAQGEIGPIAGRNFLHGFTACVVLFSAPKSPTA